MSEILSQNQMFGQAIDESQNLLENFKKKNIDSLVQKVSV